MLQGNKKNQNKKIIVYSPQNITKHKCEKNIIQFENTAISVLDRDEARNELFVAPKNGDTYINSQVAKNNSQISKSQNK